eukprot:TRINITY_DN10424_c0_g1_i1.p1 TRINITY_DN10424_c0_g1~~TRINITY_DN10424_c0_g1_i1.p1  ORF type:complete len:238 (-),score=48.88 TRINITY_DN10424_c0_g1_i1:9-722(-)
MIRLSKLMSEQGICSRREADRYIQQGKVKVDGVTQSELGVRVSPSSLIELVKSAVQEQARKVVILLNKPVGIVSTQPEGGYSPASDLITAHNYFGQRPRIMKFQKKLSTAGRLDINSKGLLVLTDDGVIVKKIIGEDADLEKEYIVRVNKVIADKDLNRLRHGLSLDGKKLKRIEVDPLGDTVYRFVLREGRKRQIRRMCELVNLRVNEIKRVRIGNVKLGNLPEGKWRFLRSNESF